MSASQSLLFTVIPRGVTLNPQTMPVSVLVSPRLVGADNLGAFPDWVNWTARLREQSLRIVFACNGQQHTAEIDRTVLRPELWQALFNAETFVRSHTFDDYSDRFIASYPVRLALSSLKGIYQTAAVTMALPQPDDGEGRGQRQLRQLVDGWQVDWDEAKGDRWRQQQRDTQQRGNVARVQSSSGIAADQIGSDGLLKTGLIEPGTPQAAQLHQNVAQQFAVFSHMPAGAPVTRESLNERTLLDFHQAITSLNAYPLLQRQLGLVFDLELPQDFVALTTGSTPGILSVVKVDGGWQIPTTVPANQTAYLHSQQGGKPGAGGDRTFLTAPRALVTGTGPLSVLGLLALDPTRFGLAQVDVDGGLHKTVMTAEIAHQVTVQGPIQSQHPEIFDTNATLAALRSGGVSLYSDSRALSLLGSFQTAKEFNTALLNNQPLPRAFGAEDLVRGYRIDVWDAVTAQWHSLHRRNGRYQVGQAPEFKTEDEEGFIQIAATQAPPNADGTRDRNDLHLHEAMARWDGWSLSADRPGLHLTRAADPDQAIPNPNAPDPENEPITPFQVVASYQVVPGSLPRLRFGDRYRFRARAVDLAGNSLGLNDPLSDLLARSLGLPNGEGTFPYLRFEPVAAPGIVLRDEKGVTGPGSSVDRLVIRSYNSDPSLDGVVADLTAGDRHIAPPRGSVEQGERHGIFDGSDGRLNPTPAMWELIRQRDAGQFNSIAVPGLAPDGEPQTVPLETAEQISLPFLPDPLARGAALRDLPGVPTGTVGQVNSSSGSGEIAFLPLEDANPRSGSATLIGFGGRDDWQQVAPFRMALSEGTNAPTWEANARLLTVFLPKGCTHTVPLSCFTEVNDLKLMGVWAWLREYIEYLTTNRSDKTFNENFSNKDQIAHILQRTVEGGHSMLAPPLLLTLVHAVQQPLGLPEFTRLNAQFDPVFGSLLQTQPESDPTAETELDALTSWRQLGSTDSFLVGGLRIHGASTAKVDLQAEWIDPVDDLSQPQPTEQPFVAFVDDVPLPKLQEGLLLTKGFRPVGYYDADHDLIGFAPSGTRLGNLTAGKQLYSDATPRHQIGDTQHHIVRYTAVATSRYRDYFPPKNDDNSDRDFTRPSAPITVHVPASARPLAPHVLYTIPTFGWQRETDTNLTRSLRQGGGLRVYLARPWWSSGEGELLGVSLYSGNYAQLNREEWKPFITQWGQDPAWVSQELSPLPNVYNFPEAVASEYGLPLEAKTKDNKPRLVNVAGHTVAYDAERQLWYCDLTIASNTATYQPFVRLALTRYQPHALLEAKLSRVVLADFVQLTPERAAMISADPYQTNQLRVVVSGPAPQGPLPQPVTPATVPVTAPVAHPTIITVVVQEKDDAMQNSDLGWREVVPGNVTLSVEAIGPTSTEANLSLWAGTLRFAQPPEPGRYRLLITEREYLSADYVNVISRRAGRVVEQPSRLVYAEIIPLDNALLATPDAIVNRTTV